MRSFLTHGCDGLKLATYAFNLAKSYQGLGEFSRAKSFYLIALEMRKRLYKRWPAHLDVLEALEGLVGIYQQIGGFNLKLVYYRFKADRLRKRLDRMC